MQQQHGENQLNVIPSSDNNEIIPNKHICEKLNSPTINEIMSNEILSLNSSNDCALPRNSGILGTSILFSDHDLKVMLTEAALDNRGDEGSFIFVARCDNGQILFVSNTINNILNIRQEEWLNVNLFTQIHPGDQEKVKEQLIILNSDIDGRKNDEMKKGEGDGGVCDECICTGMVASEGKLEKNVDRRAFNCRVKCRTNKQHLTQVNNNENSDIHSVNDNTSSKESIVASQNQSINYLTIQCNGLIRKWPTSLITTKVNDDLNGEQQLNEDEPHVHCLVAIARIKQQINQSPVSTLNQLSHHRLLPSTQLLPSTSVMPNNFNRIKQFTTKHTINGNFIYVDQRITEALGYHTGELLDKCFFDYFYHDDCKFIKETFKFIPSLKGKPMTVTYRYWSKVVSYWIWLRIVIYTNNSCSNRAAVNYIVCDCTVLPNEVTADNINNSTISSTSGGCIASSTNRKPFNSNYSNRFNQLHQHAHYNNNNNHKSVMQYNKDFIMHRHSYQKQQQQPDNLPSDQPQQLTETIFATNNGYLNNDQSSICQPFQLPGGSLTTSPLLQRHHHHHHQQQQHQSRTMMAPPPPPSQLDMYNNMLQIDSYLTGRRATGSGTLTEENILIPRNNQSNWNTAQISNTFPTASSEWNMAGELLPPNTANHSANWSFLFNNGINKTNGNSWSSYLTSENNNTELNSVEQQLDFWATLDDVNATTSIWPPSDSCNNDTLVYNCNNQQLSNSLLPTNMDMNSFRQKSNWLTENVENFENLSQFLYNNDISATSAGGVNNLASSNIYHELLTGGITCTNEQENQSNFYSEMDIANIWSQMEREQQIQLQQLIISGDSNSFDGLGLGNLIMPAAQSQAVVIGGSNKNVVDEDGNDLQQWKLNEELVNNMYNITASKINRQQSPSTSPPAIKTTSLLFMDNHGQQSPNGNNIILPRTSSPRSSPPGNSNTSNILSRLPDLIEQVLHVDQTYNNKQMITTTMTSTSTATTITNINTDISPIISQSIKTTPNTMITNVAAISSTPPSI